MSCVTTQKSGGHTYYKLSTSKRSGGKVRNTKVSVGKLDEKTGRIVIYEEYRNHPAVAAFLKRQEAFGVYAESMTSTKEFFTEDDVRNATVLSVGEASIIETAAISSGLDKCIREVFGRERGGALLSLAMFMAVKGDPLMYCRLWMEGNTLCTALPKELDSRRITELLRSITTQEADAFYELWSRCCVEDGEYLALDITSHSTWSELMGIAGYGDNRDHDTLSQVNSCLVCGEKSRMPVFQETYEGEIKDVSTLRSVVYDETRGQCH